MWGTLLRYGGVHCGYKVGQVITMSNLNPSWIELELGFGFDNCWNGQTSIEVKGVGVTLGVKYKS